MGKTSSYDTDFIAQNARKQNFLSVIQLLFTMKKKKYLVLKMFFTSKRLLKLRFLLIKQPIETTNALAQNIVICQRITILAILC